MKLPGILDPKARAERTRLKLIAKEQARLTYIEGRRRFFRRLKIFCLASLACLAGLAGLLIYLADSSMMGPPTLHPIRTVSPSPVPGSAPSVGCSDPRECRDGFRTCATGRGACSHHGGLAVRSKMR